MGSESPLSERRRGERVLIRIPIKISAIGTDGQHIHEASETVVVSRFGALLRVSTPLKHATLLEVMNSFTQQVEQFRVVWVADEAKEAKFDVGVELVNPREDFWGLSFPSRLRRS